MDRDADRTAHPAKQPEPLTAGWVTLTVAIGVVAALIGLGGMVLSFRAVSVEMVPTFGAHWAWLVPIVVDLTVFGFSGVDLVLARLDMPHPLARWTVYAATLGTVWLNYGAGGDLFGRVAHVLMPSLWVAFVELMRHVVRTKVNLSTASHREPIPAARWFLSPWPTLKLWRRMVLWRINSYPRALVLERARLTKAAGLREEKGFWWRWRVTPLQRLELNLGPEQSGATPPDVTPTADVPPVTPGPTVTPKPTVTPPRDATRPPRDTPTATPRPVAPKRDGVTVLPVQEVTADTATLLRDTPRAAWQAFKKAEAMRRADELLPGRSAGRVATLLAACGVTVTAGDVRKTRQRARDAAVGSSGPDDAEHEAAS